MQAGGNALRADLKDKLNTAAGSMSSATQTQLVYEHCMAFRFNNAIIRSFNISLAASVRGALQLMPAWARLALIVLVLLVLAAAWTLAKRTIL